MRSTQLAFARAPIFVFQLLAIGGAYFALAKLGLAVASIHPSATPIWAPTGFALAALLLWGYRIWAAIFVAAFVANVTTAGSPATSLAIAAGNTLEGVLGCALINHWSNGRSTFDKPVDVAKFALISLLATLVSATIGVGSLTLAGYSEPASFAAVWMTWWLGDVAGALVVTPAIVLWANSDRPLFRRETLLESAGVILAAVAVGLLAFSPLIEQTANRDPLGFLAIVPLLWAALRCGPRETAAAALIMSGFAIWGTLAGGGPFARATLNESFLLLIMFMISTTVPSLALSADAAVRRRAEDHLRQAHDEAERRVERRTGDLAQANQALQLEIEQRRRVEAELRQQGEQLAQAQKLEALGQLTGGIAHDFNNLLMIVSGHAQILRRRLKEAKDLRALDAINSAANRGESLTRQLLAFSRRQRLNPVVVDLRPRIEAMHEMLASSLRGNIAIKYDIADDLWSVEVDPGELVLALVNIAVNARDAMPGGGTITLSARNVTLQPGTAAGALAGDFVVLALTDTGAGIAPELMPKVFEPFFTTKAVGKGTGLGLSQVHGFAHQSGGTVTIDSELGRGTTIAIYLPRSHAPLSATPLAAEEPSARREQGTVLVVEDNAEVAEVTATLFEHLGYRVVRACDAGEAMARLQNHRPIDLVFTDIVMPGGMNGIGLAEAIRKQDARIPILLTSGYSDVAYAAQGPFALLRKPYDLPALERAIGEAVARTRAGAGAGADGNASARAELASHQQVE